mgnify:CR=1 FL=1
MHLSWLGNTTVKIQTKPFDQDLVIVINPYKPDVGNFPRNLSAHIALFTNGTENSISLGEPFILSTPGECETKGVLITAAPGEESGQAIFRVDAEDISVAHLGMLKKDLTADQLDVVSGVDILFVSVGGLNGYDAEYAVKAINTIEPRIVIPINYQSENNPKAAKVEVFLKEMGASSITPEKKIIIKAKDLPQEETKIIVLAKE